MAIYPSALWKPLPLNKTSDPAIVPRLAILHVRDGEGSSLFDYFNGPSGGVESHFYIRYSGVVEQYRDTAFQADANRAANMFAVSIETEGFGSGTWTSAQLASIKALLLWLHEVHPAIVLAVPTTWDGAGVGFHILFMDEWAGAPRSCPGANRITQFKQVIVPWMAAQEDNMPTVQEIWTTPLTKTGTYPSAAENESPLTILCRAARNVETIADLVKKLPVADAIATKVWTHGGLPDQTIWKSIIDSLGQIKQIADDVAALATRDEDEAAAIAQKLVEKIDAMELVITSKTVA